MVVALAVLSASAQQRIPCDRTLLSGQGRAATRGLVYGSSVSKLKGDVHVPVVLAAFKDVPFTIPDIAAKWDAMLNQKGFSEHQTAGCLNEYFMKQSGGQFNITFDVMGPVTLPDSMKYYGANMNGLQGSDIRPDEMVYKACVATEHDFSIYDWDKDGTIDVVMVVYAGKGENRNGPAESIWPHKFNISGRQVGDLNLETYACVAELDREGNQDGYGTFCHEFSHTLGLPDLYPISGSAYSIFDEWDLMDGGNYANNGWAAPNFSAFERSHCGWLTFKELTEATTITDMPPFDEEPVAYVIRNDDDANEYYILENRRQQGFDYFIPGNGLLVTHMYHYGGDLWPNSSYATHIDLVPADNRSYRESENFFGYRYNEKYDENGRNRYLSLAAFPYVENDSINDHLSNRSVPEMTFSDKPVSHIRLGDDDRISFDYMKEETAIRSVLREDTSDGWWYDLQGRRLSGKPSRKGVYIYQGKKVAL